MRLISLLSALVLAIQATSTPIDDSAVIGSSKRAPISSIDKRQTGVGATCGPVNGANVKGTCFNINNHCCNGFYTTGFCPGPANVQCCTETQVCRGGDGFCNNVNHVSCSESYVRGLCPGPSNVQCCRGSSGTDFCSTGH